MAKVIDFAVETINVIPNSGGVTKDEATQRINDKVASEGWTEVKTEVLHRNMVENQLASFIVLYTLSKDVAGYPDAPEAKKK